MYSKHLYITCVYLSLIGCPAEPSPPDAIDPACDSAQASDPLSLPKAPTLSQDRFLGADTCGGCHPNHYQQWKQSAHGHAMTDPVFRALVTEMQIEKPAGEERYCTQCHSAIGTRSCDITPGFDFESLTDLTLEGVTCEACHKVSDLVRPYNSGHQIDDVHIIYAPKPPESNFQKHPVRVSPLHSQAEFCGGCHDVRVGDLKLETPYQEWATSPAQAVGQTCQDCHMPSFTGRRADFPNLSIRDDLSQHRFVGIDTFLYNAEEGAEGEVLRAQVDSLLVGSGRLSVFGRISPDAPELDLTVSVQNAIAGHNLPTGSTFFRQLWVQLEVEDAEGRVVFKTGDLDEQGDLKDEYSNLDPNGDAALMTVGSILLDELGRRTFRPWQAKEIHDRSIPPHGQTTWSLNVPLNETPMENLQVRAKLLFRAYPPHLLRDLGLDDVADRLEVMTLDEQVIDVSVEAS